VLLISGRLARAETGGESGTSPSLSCAREDERYTVILAGRMPGRTPLPVLATSLVMVGLVPAIPML